MAKKPTIAQAWIGLVPTLSGSTDKIEKELGDVDAETPGKKVGSRFGSAIGVGLLAASALIAKGLSQAVADASDLTESVNAVNVSYGDAAEGVLELSKNSARAFGLTSADFNMLGVQFSSFAQTIAGADGDVAGTFESIAGRASDFASVMNLEVADAAAIFQSGLAGETEPLRKYGIDLSAAAVEAYALSEGIWDGTGAMTESQKVQARYASLMAQTDKVQGDFQNTSDGVANSQRIMKASVTNLSASIGTALLPALSKMANFLIPLVTWLGENQGVLIALGVIFGVILVGAFIAWTASIWAANVALLANPITWIVLAVVALIAIIVLLVMNWDKVVAAIGTAWEWLKERWSAGVEAIKTFIANMWEGIKARFTAGVAMVKEWLQKALDFIMKIWSYSPLGLIVTNWDKIIAFFKSLPEKVSAVFSKVGEAIMGAFRWAFNKVAGFWNDTVGKLSFTFPEWVPGVGGKKFAMPKIPMLANGGIVTRPTLALLGDNASSREAVVPLERADEFGFGGGGADSGELAHLLRQVRDAVERGHTLVADSVKIAQSVTNGQQVLAAGGGL